MDDGEWALCLLIVALTVMAVSLLVSLKFF